MAKTIGAGKNPDGSSNGQFLGTEAAKIIVLKPLSEVLTPEEGKKRLRYLGALMQQAGITATGDLFYGGVNLDLENMLTQGYFGQKDSIARIVHVADGATFQQLYGDRAVEEVTKLRYTSNEHLIFNGVKFYADDAFVSFGMELQYPGYIDNDRFKGLFMYNSKEAFLDAMRPWWNAGFQIHVHSNGSGGNQITLDALAALQAETPRFDHRFSFEHFGISSTAQARQLKALGAVVSTNPYYVSERADLNADYIGTDRASLAARMSSILKENIVLSLHSDTPVGVPSPLYEIWTAVNRIGELSRQDARAGGAGARRGARDEDGHHRRRLYARRERSHRQHRSGQIRGLRRARQGPAGGEPQDHQGYQGHRDHHRRPPDADLADPQSELVG